MSEILAAVDGLPRPSPCVPAVRETDAAVCLRFFFRTWLAPETVTAAAVWDLPRIWACVPPESETDADVCCGLLSHLSVWVAVPRVMLAAECEIDLAPVLVIVCVAADSVMLEAVCCGLRSQRQVWVPPLRVTVCAVSAIRTSRVTPWVPPETCRDAAV